MQTSEVTVNGHSTEWLQKGFPWVYPNEIAQTPKGLSRGRAVRIRGAGGVSLGTGLWDDGWLSIRRMRLDDGPLDAAWCAARVDAALSRRQGHIPPATTAWRAIHAENDDLPGLRVDVWDTEVTVLLDSPALEGLLPLLVPVLVDRLRATAVHLDWRIDPRDTQPASVRRRVVQGTPAACRVQERGVVFEVEPSLGLDAGLFPDMRDNRAWLDPWWDGATVLNLFAYTAAFSVFAARGGARRVVTEDLARTALTRAEANFRANDLDPDRFEFWQEDAFKALDRVRRQGVVFDRVVADPPSFSRAGDGAFVGERDTARLVAACARVLAPGGLLILGNNQGSFSPHQFQEAARQGAWKARRDLRLVHTGTTPVDFPASLSFPEGRYLKFWVLQG